MDLSQLASILVSLSMTLSAMQAAQGSSTPIVQPIVQKATVKTDFTLLLRPESAKAPDRSNYTECVAHAKTMYTGMNGVLRAHYQNDEVQKCWNAAFLTISI